MEHVLCLYREIGCGMQPKNVSKHSQAWMFSEILDGFLVVSDTSFHIETEHFPLWPESDFIDKGAPELCVFLNS